MINSVTVLVYWALQASMVICIVDVMSGDSISKICALPLSQSLSTCFAQDTTIAASAQAILCITTCIPGIRLPA